MQGKKGKSYLEMYVVISLFRKIPQGFLHIFSQFFLDHHLFQQFFYATVLSLCGDFLSIQFLPPGLYLWKKERWYKKREHIYFAKLCHNSIKKSLKTTLEGICKENLPRTFIFPHCQWQLWSLLSVVGYLEQFFSTWSWNFSLKVKITTNIYQLILSPTLSREVIETSANLQKFITCRCTSSNCGVPAHFSNLQFTLWGQKMDKKLKCAVLVITTRYSNQTSYPVGTWWWLQWMKSARHSYKDAVLMPRWI